MLTCIGSSAASASPQATREQCTVPVHHTMTNANINNDRTPLLSLTAGASINVAAKSSFVEAKYCVVPNNIENNELEINRYALCNSTAAAAPVVARSQQRPPPVRSDQAQQRALPAIPGPQLLQRASSIVSEITPQCDPHQSVTASCSALRSSSSPNDRVHKKQILDLATNVSYQHGERAAQTEYQNTTASCACDPESKQRASCCYTLCCMVLCMILFAMVKAACGNVFASSSNSPGFSQFAGARLDLHIPHDEKHHHHHDHKVRRRRLLLKDEETSGSFHHHSLAQTSKRLQ